MRNYELTVILSPTIAEEDLPQAMEKFQGLVTKSGGTVTDTQHWGRRRLSYPIEHHAEGTYVTLKLRLQPEKAQELENTLNIAEECLRFLLLRVSD